MPHIMFVIYIHHCLIFQKEIWKLGDIECFGEAPCSWAVLDKGTSSLFMTYCIGTRQLLCIKREILKMITNLHKVYILLGDLNQV